LIVDDNHVLALIIQLMLEVGSYETMSAEDGRDGYFTHLLFQPEVVITDLHLPGEKRLGIDEAAFWDRRLGGEKGSLHSSDPLGVAAWENEREKSQ
jgi:CheY-like chemotaxis protein